MENCRDGQDPEHYAKVWTKIGMQTFLPLLCE